MQGLRLSRNAFFDAPFLVTTLNVVKNYALAGDAAYGAIFVHYTVRSLFRVAFLSAPCTILPKTMLTRRLAPSLCTTQ